jgi:predicted Zn-dependent protease
VGLWAGGEMSHGFANSMGQFNWHSNFNFNFDWSIYLRNDKAIKQNYAGVDWNPAHLQQKMDFARDSLTLLDNTPVTIKPGRYRVFLAPQALYELMTLLNWGGFGLKSHRTATTPLLKMVREGVKLDPRINLMEHHAGGIASCFTRTGFIKPDSVPLIVNGAYGNCLANPRSAKEYSAEVNCDIEHPQSLQLEGGELHQNEALKALDTGIYISNLWYSNYSDRNHCRMTGMTRFACLWVENGEPVAPLNVMRFDESIFNILGDKLVDLTREREQIFDTGTYEKRSESSALLPGILVDDFNFTL